MKTKIQKAEKKLGVWVEKYLNGYYNEKPSHLSKEFVKLDDEIKSDAKVKIYSLFVVCYVNTPIIIKGKMI